MKIKTPVSQLYNVGPAYLKRLAKLDVRTIKDLLLHFPARYDDLSSTKPLVEAKTGESVTLIGKLAAVSTRRAKNGRTIITEGLISDDSSTLKVIFFNQPYLSRILKTGDNLILAGKIDFKPYFGRYLANPVF
jgi:ATP-dependent DNA helicase RecG